MSHAITEGILGPSGLRPSPSAEAILTWPLPHQKLFNRALLRTVALVARRQVLEIRGLEHIAPGRDPFILALNHNSRSEAILVPTLLFLHRGGKLIHFLADWNYRLIPGVGLMYRRAHTITVTRKPGVGVLEMLRPYYARGASAFERARHHLQTGRPVGIFPEGGINRDPAVLRRGYSGAARLSFETGAPIIPAGIRFPELPAGAEITDLARMRVIIGAPLHPPAPSSGPVSPAEVHAWHAGMMQAIATLSGKNWKATASEVNDEQLGRVPR